MRNKIIQLITLGIGAIIIVLTLVFFLMDMQKETIDWLAFIFVLISEVALFAALFLITAAKANKVMNFGIVSILFIYWLITMTLSILRSSILDNVQTFKVVQIVILAIVTIIILLIAAFSHNINAQSRKTADVREIMDKCESMVFSLKSNHRFQAHLSLLNQLYEAIKYGDKTVKSDKEQEIYTLIDELSKVIRNESDDNAVIEKGNAIMLLINERNLLIKQLKQGGC